ncbi:hypothetical protein ACFWN1_21495 [Streptomyces sp. NPDC058459]
MSSRVLVGGQRETVGALLALDGGDGVSGQVGHHDAGGAGAPG